MSLQDIQDYLVDYQGQQLYPQSSVESSNHPTHSQQKNITFLTEPATTHIIKEFNPYQYDEKSQIHPIQYIDAILNEHYQRYTKLLDEKNHLKNLLNIHGS